MAIWDKPAGGDITTYQQHQESASERSTQTTTQQASAVTQAQETNGAWQGSNENQGNPGLRSW